MKKILALVMAIVMMMAIAVPAFATNSLNSATKAGDTTVIVDGTSGVGDGTWSVTIPASVNLTWNTNGQASYFITSQLVSGKKVQVTLAKSQDLTSAAGKSIEFTATDKTDGLSEKEVVSNEEHKFDITITPGAWDAVPYDVYEGQISFTAEVVSA